MYAHPRMYHYLIMSASREFSSAPFCIYLGLYFAIVGYQAEYIDREIRESWKELYG